MSWHIESKTMRGTALNGFLFPMVCLGHEGQQVLLRRSSFRLCEEGRLPVVTTEPARQGEDGPIASDPFASDRDTDDEEEDEEDGSGGGGGGGRGGGAVGGDDGDAEMRDANPRAHFDRGQISGWQ